MLFSRLVYLFDSEPHDGALNMAIDEVLLRAASEPILRIYRWRHRAVSFGYFGRIEEMERDWNGVELVRRWTGGGIVPHGEDFTYTLVVPRAEEFARQSAPGSYQAVHACVAKALESHLGRRAALAEAAAPKVSNACFQNPAQHDILVGAEKIAGAAQRRTQAGLLHQGSIQLSGLGEAFGGELARRFSASVREEALTPEMLEQASALAAKKYGAETWLRRF